jgi:hypothetical protein
MAAFDLLDTVLPSGGYYSVLALKEVNGVKKRRQSLLKDRQHIDEFVQRWVGFGYDTYFACAKFATDRNRKKANVLALQSFWLDLDCGPDKVAKGQGYATQQDALAALIDFCRKTGLPKPVIVNSGGGLHVYWPLAASVTREQWEPVGVQLRDLCREHGLIVDPSVFEVARVLRIPGTPNFKSDPPKVVTVVGTAPAIIFADFCKLVGASLPVTSSPPAAVPTPPASGKGMTELGASLARKPDAKFDKILTRKDGCLQLRSCVVNRATLEEPLWFAALSVANKCIDRERAIRGISEEHSGFSWPEADAKAARTAGPAKCDHFDGLNPGLCGGCPHWGEITSPIALGTDQVPPAVEQPETVTVDTPNLGRVSYRIPHYPEGFFRPEGGGIARWAKVKGMDDLVPVTVYEFDFHLTRRMRNIDTGDCYLLRVVQPHDGLKEFTLDANLLDDPRATRARIGNWGVHVDPKEYAHLHRYLVEAAKAMMFHKKAEAMHNQLGWTKDNKSFVVGETEYFATGEKRFAPISSYTEPVAPHMHAKGSLDVWKKIADLYNCYGLEPYAFAALTPFGSPLFQFTGMAGAALHLLSPHSGTGKTTLLNVCASVYGNPSALVTVKNDTDNSRIQKLGIYKNIPYCVDEITNMSSAAVSDFLYATSSGRGKDRMERDGNRLRHNATTWSLMVLLSSNRSIYERLTIDKAAPEGEMMRLLEYKLEQTNLIDPAVAKQSFDILLKENYGLAGPIYIQYIASHLDRVLKVLHQVRAKVDNELQFLPRERHWSAMIACNMTGGMFAQELDLIGYDLASIYQWVTGQVHEIRKDTAAPARLGLATLADYLNNIVNNTLTVDMSAGYNQKPTLMVKREPKGPLLARNEKHSNRFIVAVGGFELFCKTKSIDYKQTIRELTEDKVLITTKNVRLGSGTDIHTEAARCLILNSRDPAMRKTAANSSATTSAAQATEGEDDPEA